METGGDRMSEGVRYETDKLRQPKVNRKGEYKAPWMCRCVEMHKDDLRIHLHVRGRKVVDAVFVTPYKAAYAITTHEELGRVVMAGSWEEAVGVLRG